MEITEPTFVPEWLKNSGGLSTTSHQFTSSSFPSDEQGVSKSLRNKSLDSDLGRPSGSDRTTSSYLRRPSISNGSASLRSYSSFNKKNNRDRDRDIYELRNKEKSGNKHRDYIDPLGNIFPSRFDKDGLRRSHSTLSGKSGESSWPRKLASDVILSKKGIHNIGPISSVKTSFERDFPSLGVDEKHADFDIGRVPSPGLSSAIQSLPIGSSAVIGGDGWTSALAEVPVIVGSNGNSTSVAQPAQLSSVSATLGITGCRNMAETLAHGPPRTQAAPQVDVGAQRLEELAVKQSRQLIPMIPSLPKALALNSSDKPKLKVGQSQIHTPRSAVVKPEVSKPSTVGKLLVLKPSREKNGISPTPKETLSPPANNNKLPNSPLAVPSVVGPAPLSKPVVAATLERKPSLQAQSRSNFFKLMRKKSMGCNNSSVSPETGSSGSPSDKTGEPTGHVPQGGGSGEPVMNMPSETKLELTCNGDACADATMMISNSINGKKNGAGPDATILCSSEEEEARFLRSLGWEETAEEEEEGLTEEEISAFYQNYLSLKPGGAKDCKGTEPKLVMMPMGAITSNSKGNS